jgi:hypothetical protein
LPSPNSLLIVAGLEIYRLEQKYTRRKARPGETPEAYYANGEYIYAPMAPIRPKRTAKVPANVKVQEVKSNSKA